MVDPSEVLVVCDNDNSFHSVKFIENGVETEIRSLAKYHTCTISERKAQKSYIFSGDKVPSVTYAYTNMKESNGTLIVYL